MTAATESSGMAARLTQQLLYLGLLRRIQHQQTNCNISDVWHAEIRLKHNFMSASGQLLQLSRVQLSQHCEKQKKFAVLATAPAVPQGHGCSCHHQDKSEKFAISYTLQNARSQRQRHASEDAETHLLRSAACFNSRMLDNC